MNYRLGLYEKAMPSELSWPEKLEAAKAAGVDFLEISVDETDAKLARLAWNASERTALWEQMANAGLFAETMCLSGHRRFPLGSPDKGTREQGLLMMRQAILLARDLGIRIIQIAGYDVYYEPSSAETQQLFSDGLAQSVEFAALYGVTLAFETMETDFLNSVKKAMAWVRKTDSPFLQVYPDTGNITNAALPHATAALDDLELGKGHISALHLKESLPGIYREVPYGTGHVDFEGMISRAYGMGVRRFLAEFWHKEGQDWQSELRKANAFLRKCFEKMAQDD